MKIEQIKISLLKPNPNNPRFIKDAKFIQLVKSIKEFPEMLILRPIIVDKKMVVLGGNMRLKACIEAGLKTVPIIKAEDFTEKQKAEFIIKDNVGFGEWDWDKLANEWDADLLNEWGLDVPKFDGEEAEEAEPEEGSQFFLNIRCEDEGECQTLYEKFIKEGLDVKIVT